jgi:arylformamidase
MDIYDISQTLREGMAIWPGDPQFLQRRVQRIQDGEPANVSTLEMGTHTGTHIDAPLHLDDAALDAANMPVRNFIGPTRVFSISAEKCIRAADLEGLDWQGVERALFKTRNSDIEVSSFDTSFVYFDKDAASFLAERRILLVGIDAPSADAFDSKELPSHRILLGNGIVLLESIRLAGVPPGDYSLACLPLKLAGSDGSPVRAVLLRI